MWVYPARCPQSQVASSRGQATLRQCGADDGNRTERDQGCDVVALSSPRRADGVGELPIGVNSTASLRCRGAPQAEGRPRPGRRCRRKAGDPDPIRTVAVNGPANAVSVDWFATPAAGLTLDASLSASTLAATLTVDRAVPDGDYSGDLVVTGDGQTHLIPFWVRVINR